MATFQAIGLNVAIGSGVFVASLIAFSAAVHFEWNSELAPRTWARPRQVIKNILRGDPASSPPVFYGFAWIPWTLNLSYKQLLEGIPGTGTRKYGWSGSMLKCNLDGIIAIKFHALCFKVAILATILCIGLILPINITATCDPEVSGEDICTNITSLTNFEITTLAHIPPMDYVEPSTDDDDQSDADRIVKGLERYFWSAPGITSRLFTIVFCTWAIFMYTCFLIWNEWIDNLALRRVFYLEYDHFQDRQAELEYLETLEDPELEYQKRRPCYIPHPEIRDTVPNVALYSVLFKLPDYFYSTATTPNASMLDRQLSSTVDFFDRCVPNQPGFSSSVAAVTILPDTSQVAQAWKKWITRNKKLQRLTVIRRRIRELEALEPTQSAHQPEEEIEFHVPVYPLASSPSKTSRDRMSEVDQTATDSVPQSPESSPVGTKPSISPRHAAYNKMQALLSTVDEQDGMSTSDTTEPGRNSLLLKRHEPPLDIESAGEVEMSHFTGAIEPSVKLAARSRPFDDNQNDFRPPGNSDPSGTDPEELTPADDQPGQVGLGNARLVPDDLEVSNEVCRESTPLFAGTFDEGSPTASWNPSITTGSLSPPISNENDPSLDWKEIMSSQSDQRRSPPESVRLADEARMVGMFLSDGNMEQFSVHCRESAWSLASCCPYGCDYHFIASADLETLKELEEEAEEMLQEANTALIEARADVNKMHVEIETNDAPDGSLIARPRAGTSALPEIEAYSSDNINAEAINKPQLEESKVEDRGFLQSSSLLNLLHQSRTVSSERQWNIAREIADDNRQHNAARGRRPASKIQRGLPSGKWHFDFRDSFVRRLRKFADEQPMLSMEGKKGGNLVSSVVDQHTYAVVTFTSRQAAIAARQCMTDGSGLGRWEEVEDLPVPPLANSPPWDLFARRSCCRPVTLTINDSQKRCRKNCTWLCLCSFCCLYTVPLSLTSTFLSTDQLSTVFPTFEEIGVLSGILTGLLYTGFFSVCPFIFKAFANFGSGATSERQAEFRAIRYYWIFMVVTAFTGSSLATMLTSAFYNGLTLGESAQEVLRQVAKTIPTQVSATWINWIIVRFLFSIPVLYLLQSNTFLFTFARMDCLARCTRGGGPGGPLPFRIYVDSGVVFLCIVALAPACPMVAPTGLLYFLIFTPILRWLLIFVYRPQYDGGGQRWPLLHDILVSSMIVAQILLTTMMVLKKAYGPALLAALSIVPTFMFGNVCKEKFLRCYQDAGLLQTNQLDCWGESQPRSSADREKFRQWLVDCHKASYVPICLAGGDNFLTAEPAVILSTDERKVTTLASTDFDRPRTSTMDSTFVNMDTDFGRLRTNTMDSGYFSVQSNRSYQKGALFRRVPHSISPTSSY